MPYNRLSSRSHRPKLAARHLRLAPFHRSKGVSKIHVMSGCGCRHPFEVSGHLSGRQRCVKPPVRSTCITASRSMRWPRASCRLSAREAGTATTTPRRCWSPSRERRRAARWPRRPPLLLFLEQLTYPYQNARGGVNGRWVLSFFEVATRAPPNSCALTASLSSHLLRNLEHQ